MWGKTVKIKNNEIVISSEFVKKGGTLGDVTNITPVRTSLDRKHDIYLGIRKNDLVFQIHDITPGGWKILYKFNSLHKAKKALKQLRLMYNEGKYINTYQLLNTFKYLYGYIQKSKRN